MSVFGIFEYIYVYYVACDNSSSASIITKLLTKMKPMGLPGFTRMSGAGRAQEDWGLGPFGAIILVVGAGIVFAKNSFRWRVS